MPDIKAYPMSSMEFLYDFVDIDEYNEMKKEWIKNNYDPIILLYPDKVECWLLPPEK